MEQRDTNDSKREPIVKDRSSGKYKSRKEGIQNEVREYYPKAPNIYYQAKDLDEIYELTAEFTPYEVEDIKGAIEATFSYVKDGMNNPHTCSEVLIHEFGRFSLNLRSLNIQIKNLIPYLRGKDRGEYIDKFKELWRRRQLAIYLHNRIKADGRVFHFTKGAEPEKHKGKGLIPEKQKEYENKNGKSKDVKK